MAPRLAETGRQARSGLWIPASVVRTKNPDVDLKRQYPKVIGVCLALSAMLHAGVAVLFPSFDVQYSISSRPEPFVILLEDIPETRQEVREEVVSSGPLAVEGQAMADTIKKEEKKKIDVSFFANLSVSDLSGDRTLDEEVVGFWAVSKEPVLINEVRPVYPEVARTAGVEGVVFVKFAVGSDGKVKSASVMKGPRVFHDAAIEAVYQFDFHPAMQNDKPVAVWMTLPIRFRLMEMERDRTREP
ncbi:MAG: energy transducer TonB [bacterium]|nr:energy transducer TonB [bacterium]